MNTLFLLMAEFGTGDIPLEQVAEKYLGMCKRKAYDKANYNELPFPTFRAGSTRSTRLVKSTDLAAYLDKQHADAKKEWEKINVA
jgi:hypothetical protein